MVASLDRQELTTSRCVPLGRVLRPELPWAILPAAGEPHAVAPVAGIELVHTVHQAYPFGLIRPQEQRTLHAVGLVQIEEQHPALLIAEPGSVDAFQAHSAARISRPVSLVPIVSRTGRVA